MGLAYPNPNPNPSLHPTLALPLPLPLTHTPTPTQMRYFLVPSLDAYNTVSRYYGTLVGLGLGLGLGLVSRYYGEG